MSLIADGVLIVTCLTTAIYCYVLSARLRRLSNTDEGIGQQIAQLNTALGETRAALKDIRVSAKTASDRLTRETGQANKVALALAKRVAEADAVLTRSYQAAPAAAPAAVAPVLPAATAPEPVARPEQVAAPVPELVEPAPEPLPGDEAFEDEPDELLDDEADIAEEAAEDALDGPYGAHQLGFLPELDDTDDDDDVSVLDPAGDDLLVSPVASGATAPPEADGDTGVMTVERVAL